MRFKFCTASLRRKQKMLASRLNLARKKFVEICVGLAVPVVQPVVPLPRILPNKASLSDRESRLESRRKLAANLAADFQRGPAKHDSMRFSARAHRKIKAFSHIPADV